MSTESKKLLAFAAVALIGILSPMATAFTTSPTFLRSRLASIHSVHFVSNVEDTQSPVSSRDDDDMSDEQVLRLATKAHLTELCEQFSLPTKGGKREMLQRLRDFAAEQAEKEQQRLLERRKRVEEGSEDEREKFEILDDGDGIEEDDDIGLFYYHSATLESEMNSTNASGLAESPSTSKKNSMKPKIPMNSQATVVAPPPPPVEPDENGERVVTVYSTMDHNDLTGIAAAQPGQAANNDPLTSTIGEPANTPWDMNDPEQKESTSAEIESAKDEVSDLVQSLLALSGAPAFQEEADDLSFLGVVRQRSSHSEPTGFIGFDPANVPTDMLTKASKSIRISRGVVLRDILREFELRAVGYDGEAGDDIERGGGHYRQVSKVRSFLEGFRRAEVRKIARDTTTLLLDKLVSEGIDGLDVTLASMARSNDDTNDHAGDLNDSLLDYLNDAIRQQEKKVEQMVDSIKKIEELENAVTVEEEDQVDELWTVESDDGQRIETFDPNDPKTQKVLQEEQSKAEEAERPGATIPTTAPEKLLLLLKLLRERVKTEAAFSVDEKSRNLRVLAYCLNVNSDDQRKELILKEFGGRLDRLDSFAELVSSSIEYGESTSHQLQPAKQGSLNVRMLKRVLHLTKEIKDSQSWKASGVKSNKLR